ncbi:prominin-1-A-like [Alligator mississippiensis]|uniref:Prominin-1-A-like n=1 Tax=Alligator mississippiensis TaxID=8496 RepID=A0A151MKY3_ALLMI|nr:prominin-1-A-like [Alligator mississippiensis]
MLLVLLSFLLGGNGYVLVCRSWHDRQLFQFLETQGMIPSFNPETLGLQGQTLNLSQVYNACQHDAPLWSALDLGQAVPLDELLNLSQYTTEIRAAFAETNLTLAPVVLLSTEQTDLLRTLGNTTRLTNLTDDRQKLSTIPSQEQLLGLADELDRLANVIGTRAPDRSKELRDEAAELRQLDKEMETRLRSNVRILNETLQRLQKTMHQVPMLVDSVLEQMKQAEVFLDTRVAATIQNESQLFLHRLLGFFETYVAWAKGTLTGELGRCRPVAQALDSVETIACRYMLDSLNAFWFSLGACTVLLLPGLILATRLAKFYRRMDYADVHENDALEM